MANPSKSPLSFRLATLQDKPLIQEWWTKPHVMEFWDNSPEMWQNVENYLHGQKDLFDYWLGYYEKEPFALLMTSEFDKKESEDSPYAKWIDPQGLTIGIDFMIGNEEFIGKKLSYVTLNEFAYFMKTKGATAVIIDPADTNPRAIHVYQKAGFEIVDTFISNTPYFSGVKHYLMKMKLDK